MHAESMTFGCKLCNRSLGDAAVHETKWTSHVKRRNDSARIYLLWSCCKSCHTPSTYHSHNFELLCKYDATLKIYIILKRIKIKRPYLPSHWNGHRPVLNTKFTGFYRTCFRYAVLTLLISYVRRRSSKCPMRQDASGSLHQWWRTLVVWSSYRGRRALRANTWWG